MGNARFEPRLYFRPPESFGRTANPDPGGDVGDDGYRAAAVIQHQACFLLRQALKEKKLSLPQFAEQVGVRPDRMRRILRGEIVMQLTDMANLRHAGLSVGFRSVSS